MERIQQFMQELKALSEKHGIRIVNVYDERLELRDESDETLSEYVDIGNYTATPYVEPVYEINPNAEALAMSKYDVILKAHYEEHIKEVLNEEPLMAKASRRANR